MVNFLRLILISSPHLIYSTVLCSNFRFDATARDSELLSCCTVEWCGADPRIIALRNIIPERQPHKRELAAIRK